jgi:hypothetical protein
MRFLIAGLLGCHLLALVLPASAQTTFPYKATVLTDGAYVRSGPGQDYYPTEKLRRGQEVEVYRHDAGGWCAIRPPRDSFTWIPARFLRPTEDNLAVVTREGVSACVGSRLSQSRDVVQVRLHKGESVEILETPRDSGEEAWLKIAPPSGEFRWVAAKYLDVGSLQVAETPRNGRQAAEPATDAPPKRSTAVPSLSPTEFQQEMERVELELSVILLDPPSTWSFDSLRERADVLFSAAQTAVERGQAKLLAEKIARFDNIRRRQDAVFAMRDKADRAGRRHGRPGDRDNNDIDGRFDGIGQLTQVVSPKVGAPRYALIDHAGDVRCYVTPAPGVHLQDYIGRNVGVIGTRGYMPEQHASHIMVRHVTPLEGQTILR